MIRDVIAATATSSKNGSISVIRVSGDDVYPLVSRIFYNEKNENIDLDSCDSHTIHYGFIRDEKGELLDEVLVLVMRAPRSYTGENVAEIQCHGGFFICRMILKLLVENGVRPAEPGEFTKRAFLNGRLDLSQAESVMDIIQSKSRLALENSLTQLRGGVRDKIISLRNIILEDIAFLEAALDDPEHISLDHFPETVKEHNTILRGEVDRLLKNSQNGRLIREGIRTAIVGKPNVGKSSFLNCILREDRAIVTDIPGTTRDTLEEEMMIGDTLIHLVDTAGIRDTEDEIESIGIEKARRSMESADFVISVLDSNSELSRDDIRILKEAENKPGVVLLNKSDLEQKTASQEIEKYTDKKIIIFSARTGGGLEELEEYLHDLFIQDKIDFNEDIYITNMRQRQALLDTQDSLNRLRQSVDGGMPEDLYAIDMKDAYEALGKIIGETVEDDIIDKIFKDFCMGK